MGRRKMGGVEGEGECQRRWKRRRRRKSGCGDKKKDEKKDLKLEED